MALSLGACAAVPWSAFLLGHPFRIRYAVPLLAAEAVGLGAFASVPLAWLARRPRSAARAFAAPALAVMAIVATGYALRPLDAQAPMVVEAQWDRANGPARQRVTDCLRAEYRGDTIMASMGSLAHYMQELSHEGIAIRDFVHEGNLPYWQEAIESPKDRVGWILIEEWAEGGDVLAARERASSQFLTGFRRMCDGGGVALYKAQ